MKKEIRSTAEWKEAIEKGQLDKTFEMLYGMDKCVIQVQRERYLDALAGFVATYGEKEEVHLFSAPGRSEISGNHTDHNHGLVLAASINLDAVGVAARNDEGIVRVLSQGREMDVIDLSKLDVKKEETNSSPALVRGVAAGFVKFGFRVGGYDAYTVTSVLKGSGLSSSAAFEILLGQMMNGLYNDQAADAVMLARIGQYAENVYFGKASGILDQMSSAVGGFVWMDFEDPTAPVVRPMKFDLSACGYALCIIDTGGSHSDLSDAYSAIPYEMKSVAKLFGKEVLRQVDEREWKEKLPALRGRVSDRAILRSLHFFAENKRVNEAADALEKEDLPRFFAQIIRSGNSSFRYLQNVYASAKPEEQGLSLALAMAEELLEGKGAWRVHGGGFAGTVQCFVPLAFCDEFSARMEEVFGKGSCHRLRVRPVGGLQIG